MLNLLFLHQVAVEVVASLFMLEVHRIIVKLFTLLGSWKLVDICRVAPYVSVLLDRTDLILVQSL